jgi:hypothetical protein
MSVRAPAASQPIPSIRSVPCRTPKRHSRGISSSFRAVPTVLNPKPVKSIRRPPPVSSHGMFLRSAQLSSIFSPPASTSSSPLEQLLGVLAKRRREVLLLLSLCVSESFQKLMVCKR